MNAAKFVDQKKVSPFARNISFTNINIENNRNDAAVLDKQAWRKMDFTVLPVVTMIYFLSFLDKGNIGNTRIAGLQKDLSMSNYQYSLLLTITFIPYIIIELPSNLWLQRVGPNVLLPVMVLLWGIAAAMQGVVTSYGGLVACRFFLGLFEGGLLPGITLYLSTFYPRDKLQLRIAIFFASTTLAGAFSGLLASAILHMDGVGGRPGWAWIFILEGLFTFLFGILSFFLLPRTPSHITFLTEAEKAHINTVLYNDVHTSYEPDHSPSSLDEKAERLAFGVERKGSECRAIWGDVWKTMKLSHVWLCVLAGFFNGATLSGLAYFAPSIVASLGYTANEAQLMSVPTFAVAFLVCLASSYFSDQCSRRGLTIIVFSVMSIVGFGMFIGSHNAHVRYASLFLVISATYSTAPPLAAWTANNSILPSPPSKSSPPSTPSTSSTPSTTSTPSPFQPSSSPHTPQATSIALLTMSTNFGGILATWLLGSWSRAPEWELAGWVLGSFQIAECVCAGVCLWVLVRKRRVEGREYVL